MLKTSLIIDYGLHEIINLMTHIFNLTRQKKVADFKKISDANYASKKKKKKNGLIRKEDLNKLHGK